MSQVKQETLELLSRRRSAKAAMLGEPGPSPQQLETILTVAARVPDHKKLEPWRFIVFEGDARALFGRVLLKACLAEDKDTPSAARLETVNRIEAVARNGFGWTSVIADPTLGVFPATSAGSPGFSQSITRERRTLELFGSGSVWLIPSKASAKNTVLAPDAVIFRSIACEPSFATREVLALAVGEASSPL